MKARADAVSASSRAGVEKWLLGMPGCTVIQGHALEGPTRSGSRKMADAREFSSTSAAAPPCPTCRVLARSLPDQYLDPRARPGPEHLVVVGGSYIGLEFAQMYRRFGADVTIVEKGPRLIAREDEEVSEAIRAILVEEGITVRTEPSASALAHG